MQSTVLAKNANFGYRYSLSFHLCSGSTDAATLFSILYRCTSSEALSASSSESESASISLKRFSLGSHIVLLTLLASSCTSVFNQSSLGICCSISDQVCSFASSDQHFEFLYRGSRTVAIFKTAMLFILATRSLKSLIEASLNQAI